MTNRQQVATDTTRCARAGAWRLAASLGLAAVLSVGSALGAPAWASHRSPALCMAGPDPFAIDLVPTANANRAWGNVELRFVESPFGIAVTADGSHRYQAIISTTGLPPTSGTNVVWAATPSLDRVQKLGVLGEDGSLNAEIVFPKFLVFVTAETSAGVDSWSGPILLRGISASGRMHTMAGHGPFQGEPCPFMGFRRGG